MPFAVVGLTGGIASGKSAVSTLLREKGAQTINADEVGHALYADKESDCYSKLVEHFGQSIVNAKDGSIDRRILGGIVFGNAEEMKKLQSIVWPRIALRLQELIEQQHQQQEDVDLVVVVEAAILFEAGWDALLPFNLLVAVEVDPACARSRLMARNGLSAEEADKRISSQMSNEERAARVSAIINNSGSEEELAAQVEKLWTSVMEGMCGGGKASS